MLANPLDRRELDQRIRIRQKAWQTRRRLGRSESRSISSNQPLTGVTVFAPASATSSSERGERTPQTKPRRLLNERIVGFKGFQEEVLRPGSNSRRNAGGTDQAEGSEAARSFESMTPAGRIGGKRTNVGGFVVERSLDQLLFDVKFAGGCGQFDRSLIAMQPPRDDGQQVSRRWLGQPWTELRSRQIRPLPCSVV